MAARLPNPGSDDGVWGDILNTYLAVGHNTDGTVKDAGVVAQKYVLPVGGIPKTDLSSGVQASLDNADAAVAGTAPPASSTTPGLVQLTGDLGGTSTSPTVPGLAAKADTSSLATVATSGSYADLSNKPTIPATKADVGLGNVDNTSDANKPVSTATQTALNLKANLASPTFTGTVTVPAPSAGTDAANKTYVDGVAGAGAPDASTSTKGIVKLAGDLAGTAALPTVPGLAGKANTSHTHASADIISGTIATARLGSGTANSTTYLRGDNTWATPAGGGGGQTATAQSTTYTASAGDFIIADASGAGFTVTLPAATNGARVSIKKVDATGNAIIVAPQSGQIDNQATIVVNTQWQSQDLFSDGTKWYQV